MKKETSKTYSRAS